jgi:MFS transporter, Spinster family, sphingosine-1-phosphate transporter
MRLDPQDRINSGPAISAVAASPLVAAPPSGFESPTGRPTGPSNRQSPVIVLVMITAVYVVSYMDRQLFALMLPDIDSEFGLTDTQIGQLTGIAFPIIYALTSLTVAFLADRINRVRLIGLCVLGFSSMTALCGMSQGFWSLFAARLGVGIGEGGPPPPSLSLIADHFEGPRRQWANSVYSTAAVFGMLAAYVVLGNVSAWLGWRVAFYGAGAFGLAVGIAVLCVLREAPRRTTAAMSLADLKGFPALFRIRSLRWALGAAVLNTVLTESSLQWLPLLLSRSLGLSKTEISWFLGMGYSILGLAGISVGSAIATRLRHRSVGAPQYLGTGVMVCITIAYTIACSCHDARLALTMLGLVIFLTISCYGALLAFVQDVTPIDSHAKASAILFLLMQLGFGAGSFLIGVLSDYFATYYGHTESLRYALLPVIIVSGTTASLCYAVAARLGDTDAARVTGESTPLH